MTESLGMATINSHSVALVSSHDSELVVITEPGAAVAGRLWLRRHPVLATVIGLFALASAYTAFFSYFRIRRPR